MQSRAILNALSIVCAAVLIAACSDVASSPAAPQVRAVSHATPAVADLPAAFTARASIGPYFINQQPDFMIRSRVTADLAIQRLVTPPGVGSWHTHPGPSFAIVEQGRVMLTRYSPKDGCTETVYGPGEPAGNTYYEEADEVHRATVLEPETAVEAKVRFNLPVGAPFATPASEPSC